jgi:type I restriction enzyme S subunit
MASEWASRTIESLCVRVTSGGTPRTGVTAYYDGGSIPWVTTKEVNFGPVWSTETCITERGMAESSAKLMPADTVIVAMYGRGTAGRVAYARVPVATNQACCNLVVEPAEADPRFVYYALWAAQARLDTLANGSVQQNLSARLIRDLRIGVPSLAEQRAIAHILGTLDDKIELNRRMNETLEAIAQALFKSWFVDFNPVRAKAEGRDPGLPQQLADLFPDSFEDSELGEIPKGWRVTGLDETAKYLNGLALQKHPPNDGSSLPVIKIAQLRAGHPDGADRASADIPPAYVVEDGDVLFSWSGSLEVEIWCGGRGALNQHLFKVTSSRFPKWFYFLWTRHHLADFRGIAAGKATTMGHIQRGHLSAARALVPPPRLVEAMSAHFEPLLEDLIAGRLQSHTLAALRDALLPKIIAGELRVSDAERSVGSMQ